MNRLLRHRGPDDEGYFLITGPGARPIVCGGPDTPPASIRAQLPFRPERDIGECLDTGVVLALGHRRLSVVDLSPSGHQPMCTDDRRFWIVYNGEIYNHHELRVKLEALGHHFNSSSDTQVVLAAYQEWGADCLSMFKGMWAFAIYDQLSGKLFMARDRFGIKPLYYWNAPGNVFCFASEIKAFTAWPGWSARINPQRAYDFLVWSLLDHTDETMFSGVYQLQPGHFMQVPAGGVNTAAQSDGRVAATRWYILQAQRFTGSFRDAAAEFRGRFSRSVREHLRSDVPVGSCLSGGLDSSSIVCVVNQLLAEDGNTGLQSSFSACTREARFDERAWIDIVVADTGVDAHFVYPVLEDLFADLRAITWHQDEPFGSTSIFAQWSVFRLAAGTDVKVMLDGQGADELLAGYHSFFGPRFASLLRSGHLVQLAREMQQTGQLHGHSALLMAMWTADAFLPESLRHRLRARAGKAHATPGWLNLERLGAVAVDPKKSLGAIRSVEAMSIAQLTASNLQMLLHWEDRDSMAHSIESRVPFLDHELVEFVLGLPDEYKLKSGITKRVQRAGMDGILPDRIRDRMDKIGFQTPEEVWLREQGAPSFIAKLDAAVSASRGILNIECVDMLRDMIAGKRPFNFVIWRLISFGDWVEAFSVDTSRLGQRLEVGEQAQEQAQTLPLGGPRAGVIS
jgi:asparagine synthase (glutamine-hydrolysing)